MLSGLLFLSACAGPAPAATLAPTITPAPPATPTLLPPATETVVPPADAGPPTATRAPSATPAPTADPLHTVCDYPYWPLRQGAVWHIDTKSKVYTETITAVSGDLTKAEATLVDTYTNGSTQKILIECDKDGLAYGNAVITNADGHVSTKTVVNTSGHFLIAAAQLLPGAKWSWSLTADYSVPLYDSKGVFTKQSQYRNVSSQDCTLTKTDALTLTVGVFQAKYLDCKGSDVSTSNGTSTTYPFSAQLAHALGVGPNGSSIVSYTIP